MAIPAYHQIGPWQERFWARVDRRGDDECWPWIGSIDEFGYGRMDFRRHMKVTERAHRLAYFLAYGPVRPGFVIDHLCRNRGCVNPSHLEVVTRGENMRRGDIHGEANYHARLTPEQVREIRASTLPSRQLAPLYGVSDVSIWKVRARKTWAHID
jgi:hypothetical protein